MDLKQFDRFRREYDHAKAAVEDEKRDLVRLKECYTTALEAQQILQAVAAHVQDKAHRQIAGVVTKCLQAVFGREYGFKIAFAKKRGKTEARLVFLKNRHEIDPTEDSSGGTIDVAAFALKVSCILLAAPRRRRFLSMDEPFKNVHGEEYERRCAAMVEAIAEELNFQFLIVTGLDWLRIGKVVEL